MSGNDELRDLLMRLMGAQGRPRPGSDEEHEDFIPPPGAFMPLVFNKERLTFTPINNPDFDWPVGMKIVEAEHCTKCDDTLDNCDCGIRLSLWFDDVMNWLHTPDVIVVTVRALGRAVLTQDGIVRCRRTIVEGVNRYNDSSDKHKIQRIGVGYFAGLGDWNADKIRKTHEQLVDSWKRWEDELGVDLDRFKV